MIFTRDCRYRVFLLVGDTGIEPVTSSVSGTAGQFSDLPGSPDLAGYLRKRVGHSNMG